MNRMRRQRVNAELEAVAWAIMRSIFSTRRISERAFVTGVRGCFSSIAPTLLDGAECVNCARMLKKSASGVLASLRGLTYRSVRLASSLAAALLDSLFEHPVWCPIAIVIANVQKNETSAHLESFFQTSSPS